MYRALRFVVAFGLIVGVGYWFFIRSPYPTAEAALEAFYRDETPECMILDPLRAHGKSVVPLLIRDLPNKKMPGRTYAISFLGEGKYSEALPVLEPIALDGRENLYVRANALEAIYHLSPERALDLVRQIEAKPYPDDKYGSLKRTLGEIKRGEVRRRSEFGCG